MIEFILDGSQRLVRVEAGEVEGFPRRFAFVRFAVVADTCQGGADYNDLDSVETLFRQYPDQIAAIIVEPVAGNMGVVPPVSGFLEGLRAITTREGSILIFDEMMTGFRVHRGGEQKSGDF